MSLTDAGPAEAARAAKTASHILATLSADERNSALTAMHSALTAARETILEANAADLAAAEQEAAAGRLNPSLVSRLDLGRKGKWEDMLQGILDVRALPDPLGIVTIRTRLDDGLELERVSCPIGVLLVIFEARPEVLANIAALAVKSGNAALLKGGKESTRTMLAMAAALSTALLQKESAVPSAAVQLVTRRDVVAELLALDRDIDLVVPRGSNELVRSIKAGTRIPVLGHADGICSVFLDIGLCSPPDAAMAAAVLLDAKTGYPAACNSVETLLVHADAVEKPAFAAIVVALLAAGVTLHCDEATLKAASAAVTADGNGQTKTSLLRPAVAADFDTEFLSLDLAVRTVPSLTAAIVHINEHGSHHTDAILSRSSENAEHFMAAVDSAGVYWNASTRFADGMRYGFGTEVGISTNKIHSRGPVGLEGLTIYKYKLRGTGQAASQYGDGKRYFKHEPLPLL
ncbi:gamma-glutamyl phosphate reductase [Grosmannia clavigera kw1407]|uniref:glutamate-5-semialdehyde dehydrogenase n=1 Tax=Grosmannia clavigera (strain kw1407 / UAMH 11150) TaxID=655863 RepID=F0XFB4_GROCL|nr:gamma-glutamyl phosphate reductase [Grosmannia clavigera kw1407]EFX03748.1 gamma-glutamyl phosphate reductase [Grosmannia clavigera kw1407]